MSLGAADRLDARSRAARSVLARLAAGELQVLFGTHALLEQSVAFKRLYARDRRRAAPLRRQPAARASRQGRERRPPGDDRDADSALARPHALRRPGRPRTCESARGDRAAVTTVLVKSAEREPAYERVRRAVQAGQQAYVVCALVDESDAAQARAATREAERLRKEVFSRPQRGPADRTNEVRPRSSA